MILDSTPIALTIAGSDPSGGAGLQADLKTFSALGVYGATIVTALTAQNTTGVIGIHRVPADFIRLQAQALSDDLRISAVKTGMLGDAKTVETVVTILSGAAFGPLVVDPVMVATSGDVLLAPDAMIAVRDLLIPLATLITPNLHEAARLLGERVAEDASSMERQARRLRDNGARAVLIKGGHATGDEAIDVLVTDAGVTHHARPRIETRNTHGTGCTLSAAIAAHLAQGVPTLEEAVARSKSYLWHALDAGRSLRIGHGCGPVDHLFALRNPRD